MKTEIVNEENEVIAEVICPLCGSVEIGLLGRLAKKVWFRCQSCGIDFNTED
jgi:transposase-like protein